MSEILEASPELPGCIINPLDEQNTAVLALISEGHTGSQIARQLDCVTEDITTAKDEIRRAFRTTSLSKSVGIAVRASILRVDIEPDPEVEERLRPQDIRLLGFYARGGSNRQLIPHAKSGMKYIEQNHDRLLEIIGAWSRPHGVRRTFELGLLTLPQAGVIKL